MTQDRIYKLNKIEIVWEVQMRQLTDWEDRLAELKEYWKKHSPDSFPNSRTTALGRWVCTQRKQYKKFINGKKSWLTQERIDKLNEIDFVWEVQQLTDWDDRLAELKELLAEQKEFQDDPLGRWVSVQRKDYKRFKETGKGPMTKRQA